MPLQASACSSYQRDLLLMTDKTANQVACFDKLNLVFIEVIALIIFNQHLEAGEQRREDKGGLNEASASALAPACFLFS